MMKKTVFTGMATALVTPMTLKGIDYDAYGRFIDFQIENGINALVAMGTTGENATIEPLDQAEVIRCGDIVALFRTEIGQKMISSNNILREFKFSILDDAASYAEDVLGEKVLLQGVVDCAILEEDGITIIDFKTDFVTSESLTAVAESYRAQVEAYAQALENIYDMPIKSALLYFFKLQKFVSIK